MSQVSSFLGSRLSKAPFSTLVIFAIIFFALGWLFFSFISHYNISFASTVPSSSGVVLPNRLSQTEYPLINPLLFCNAEQNNSSVDLGLKKKVTDFINDRVSKGMASSMAVYIQEYGAGRWLGVNENDRYDPASLLKVPLMVAYYQIAEKTPSLLSQKTSFSGDDQNTGEYFKSNNDIVAGVSYTIDDLIKSMIVNSDNTATILLSNYVNKSSLYDVYSDLGLPTPPQDPTIQYISAKSYAYFFRILYNATYLSRSDSQKALDLLSEGHLPNGIASAVPSDITVANKFGERSVYDKNNTLVSRELHDCGIVYKPGSPYLICVMSKGSDFDNLAQNIHDLSTLVYNNVNK